MIKGKTKLEFLFMATMLLSLSFNSCKDEDVEDHPLIACWMNGNIVNSDHLYSLWIKNDSLFSFEVAYNVYDGVSWYEISGVKTYTGHYSIDGKKLVMISDSMFIQKNCSDETIDTITQTQTIFKDCEYEITGKQLRIDYTILLDTPPAIKRTMYFYYLEY
jgi:hypothetical protein